MKLFQREHSVSQATEVVEAHLWQDLLLRKVIEGMMEGKMLGGAVPTRRDCLLKNSWTED